MRFKKVCVLLSAILFLSAFALAGTKEFNKGSFYLTPQIGINEWAIPFGVNAEYAMTPNIGIGGTVMFWLWGEEYWSESIIALSAEVNYHFTQLNANKFDLYAGGALGYSIYSWKWKSGFEDWLEGSTGTSGLDLGLVLGGRYYFTPKIAASLRLAGSLIGHWAGFGSSIGVTFYLK